MKLFAKLSCERGNLTKRTTQNNNNNNTIGAVSLFLFVFSYARISVYPLHFYSSQLPCKFDFSQNCYLHFFSLLFLLHSTTNQRELFLHFFSLRLIFLLLNFGCVLLQKFSIKIEMLTLRSIRITRTTRQN